MGKYFLLILLSLFVSSACFAQCQVAEEYKKCSASPKGEAIKPGDPISGLKYIEPDEAMKFFGDDNFVFVDTRPKELYEKCHIRKAVHLEFATKDAKTNALTKEELNKLVSAKKTVIFYCNALECYRSLNASVQACEWGIPLEKIRWLGKGVPGVVKASGASFRKYTEGKECSEFQK